MSADHKYSVFHRDNLRHPIQMQLSQKQNKFSEFVSPCSKSILKFEHFEKKYQSPSWCISDITGSQKRD